MSKSKKLCRKKLYYTKKLNGRSTSTTIGILISCNTPSGFSLDSLSLCYTQHSAKMMHMTFYWGSNVTLLFDSWRTNSWWSYGLTLFACFIVSAFYQYSENKRLHVTQIGTRKPTDIEMPLLKRNVVGKISVARIAGTVLFGVNAGLGYLLMLAVMSFNGGVFLAIVAGLTVGFLMFRSGNDDSAVVVDNPCACA